MNLSLYDFLASKKAVIFDLYHTLTATEITSPGGIPTASFLGIDRKTWSEYFMDRSRDRLTGKITDPYTIVQTLAHAIDPAIPEELIRQATELRIRRFRESLEKMPEESVSTVRHLWESGKKTALLSNADSLEIIGWPASPAVPYFDVVIFSCEVGYMKPDKEIYELCLGKLHQKPGDCVFVGDGGSNELAAAKELGIATVMVKGIARLIWPEKLKAIEKHADYIIENVKELVVN